MQDPPLTLPEQSQEAIHAAKNAAQAIEIARQEQLDKAAEKAAELAANRLFEDDRLTNIVHAAVMKGFSFEDTEDRRRFIDVTKEKLICQSIVNISGRLDNRLTNEFFFGDINKTSSIFRIFKGKAFHHCCMDYISKAVIFK